MTRIERPRVVLSYHQLPHERRVELRADYVGFEVNGVDTGLIWRGRQTGTGARSRDEKEGEQGSGRPRTKYRLVSFLSCLASCAVRTKRIYDSQSALGARSRQWEQNVFGWEQSSKAVVIRRNGHTR